jgi:uncharacterized protein YehS (DUF1456 family)
VQNQRAYSIPEIKPVIKAKKAKNARPCGLRIQKLFRNDFTDAAGG